MTRRLDLAATIGDAGARRALRLVNARRPVPAAMPARRDTTRRSAAAWLALLLLFVQLQALLHPISHLGERVPQEPAAGLSTSHDADACVVCALLASGADSPTRSSQSPPPPSGVIASPASAVELHASTAPAWYESRAPPVLP